jgi:hypothetical protein
MKAVVMSEDSAYLSMTTAGVWLAILAIWLSVLQSLSGVTNGECVVTGRTEEMANGRYNGGGQDTLLRCWLGFLAA